MAKPQIVCRALLLGLAFHSTLRVAAVAQTARDMVLEVTATTAPTVPHITLNWITPGGVTVTAQKLWKRPKGSTNWGTAITLGAADTTYPDTTASPGVAYEYSLQRTRSGTPATVYGAIVAGYNLPLVESRGNVCLLVDASMSIPLAPELAQLTSDMTADGWTVFRHDMPRAVVSSSSTNSVDWPTRIAEQSAIRAIAQADYNTAPTAPWVIFIVGRVPVPYSGLTAPDGHSDHVGAWPTDAYYGDVDGTWTDTSVNNTSASDARNDNVPGDGKFDHSIFPSAIEMQVGRLDMTNMAGVPTGQTEIGLLRQYLVRDHRFRRGEGPYASVQSRALIDDSFGYFSGEAFSSSSWRAAVGFFGRNAGQVDALDWFDTLGTTPVLVAYGAGGGSYTSAGGVGTSTLDFGRLDSKAVFTELFGSYFGDWDVSNNFLRSPLAGTQDSLGLTCTWSGRGQVHNYHMALGETVGYGVRYSQNSSGSTSAGEWFQNGFAKGVQINLMGDPTLRLHTVRPVSRLVATSGAGVQLSWQHSPDSITGYHVYRATSPAGPYTRITGGVPTAADPTGGASSSPTFTDNSVVAGSTYYYSVKAARIESSASGTYANQSLGETVGITHNGPAPPVPTRLTVSGAAATAFNLSWDDNATTETGYEVQRRNETTGAWGVVATLGANAASFVDTAGVAGVPNHYRVRALGSAANSEFSSVVADPNQTGIARIASDYMLVSENAGALSYPIIRFSGTHGAASANWSITDIVSSTSDYSATSGLVSWLHGQSGVENINLGITNYPAQQLTKVFRLNLNSASGSVLGSPTTGYVQIFDPSVRSIPVPWFTQAVGSVTQEGYVEHLSGSFGISAVTGSISAAADSFGGIHRLLTGNCRITARISARSSAASSTRAGIMIRSGLNGDEVMCSAVTTSGTTIQRAFRTTTAGTADTALSQGSLTLPLWLRLTRTGDDVALQYSSNGTSWTAFGTAVTLTGLGASPFVSLVMASNTSASATYGYARFDNVSAYVQPSVPGVAAVPGAEPGQIALSWPAASGAEAYVIERSTTSGSGFAQIAQVSTPGYTDSGLAVTQTYYYRVRADNPAYQSAFSTEASAAPYNPPTVDGWRYRSFGTTSNSGSAADLADPDGDGLVNLFECTFGQAPLAPSALAITVAGRTMVLGSPRLTLSFIRDTTLTGVVLQAESAGTLSGPWTQFDPLSPANQLSVQGNTPAPGLETITIKDVQGIAPGESRFMRLRVTRP